MITFGKAVIAVLLVWACLGGGDPVVAESHGDQSQQASEESCAKSTIPRTLDADQRSVTDHVLKAEEGKLKYTATAGSLPVTVGGQDEQCTLFFVGYHAESKQKGRPVSFVFNGGPGASSVYLHLGALGPKVVPFKEGGGMPDFPYALKDNARTWLWFTDLVFVDPVGTGYSRCAREEGHRSQKPDERGPRMSPEKKAWGVEEDVDVLARFIRLYLTRQERWLSPKFLVGESYGGLRVAALADRLQSQYGISVNGAVLVSPALEFGLLKGGRYNVLPWIVSVPSFAATARFHGRASGEVPGKQHPRGALKEVERFAVKKLLPALADGNAKTVGDQLAAYVGLSDEDVSRWRYRISLSLFVRYLLEDKERLVSVYDGTQSATDPSPGGISSRGQDSLLVRLNAVLTPLMNSYVRETLGFESDIRYRILNEKTARRWNWRSGLNQDQGFVGVAEDLKRTMSMNPKLQVLVTHGVYDLITPYFGSVLVIGQMALDSSLAANVTVDVYDGGHMFYTHPVAHAKFFDRAKAFFEKATGVHRESK